MADSGKATVPEDSELSTGAFSHQGFSLSVPSGGALHNLLVQVILTVSASCDFFSYFFSVSFYNSII